MAQLLSAMGGGGASIPSREEALNALLESRPEARPLIERLLRRDPEAEEAEAEDDLDVPALELSDLEAGGEPEAADDAAGRLQLAACMERLAVLAAALGACPLCFGEAEDCPDCGGQGVPGGMVPDPAAFNVYVLPAARRASSAARALNRGAARPPKRKETRHE
jgi:hypothetical protein